MPDNGGTMKVRCNLCGKIFSSPTEYLSGEHDKRVHGYADSLSTALPLVAKNLVETTAPVKAEDVVR